MEGGRILPHLAMKDNHPWLYGTGSYHKKMDEFLHFQA